eukprot:scaffold16043_cov115-Isochrysis_galbana.AAC.2
MRTHIASTRAQRDRALRGAEGARHRMCAAPGHPPHVPLRPRTTVALRMGRSGAGAALPET